jgi:signal peptidase II
MKTSSLFLAGPAARLSLLVFLVLLIDQALKVWVKTNMQYGSEFTILGLNWAIIHFVENPGMAFGYTFGGTHGKLALSLFRVAAVVFLLIFIRQLIRERISFSILASFGLVLAGALGNIIDSAFYGMIFSESPYYGGLAQLFPPEGGYAGFLHGKVVDMLYFPIFQGVWPDFIPYLGGRHFLFFKPVFNIADLSITVGVLNILIFQWKFFRKKNGEEDATPPVPPSPPEEE